MRIQKVLNNNVVSSVNNNLDEIIVMGKGIGFQKKSGSIIEDSKVEKIFVLNDKNVISKLEKLFLDIPEEYLEIADEIIQYARKKYNFSLRENIYLSLTDHIGIAVERLKLGIEVPNVMLSDIKCFYKKEFDVGMKALEIIEQRMQVVLPEDEAGFVALHILNSTINQTGTNNLEEARITHEILDLVKNFYKFDLDEDSIAYFRLTNHLHYLSKRLLNPSKDTKSDDILYKTAKKSFPLEYKLTSQIEELIKEKYELQIQKEDLGYLIVNLRALIKNKSN